MDAKINTSSRSLIGCCRLVTHFTHAYFKIPSVDKKFVIEQVAVESTPPNELREFERISSNNIKWILILICCNIAFVFKTGVTMRALHSVINYHDHEGTIKYLGKDLHQFSCVITNCTSIMEGHSLAQDLGAMPLFSICFPFLSKINVPIVLMEDFGMLTFALSAFGVLLTGVLIPALQILSPRSADTIMFLPTPIVVTRMTRDRVIEYLGQVSESYSNFIKLGVSWCRRIDIDSRARCRMGLATEQSYEARMSSEYLDDCMPLVRSSWWRQKLAKIMFFNNILFSSFNFSLILVVVFYINYRGGCKQKLIKQMSWRIQELGCGVWEAEDTNRELIDFVKVANHGFIWPIYSWIETSIVLVAPVLCVAMFVGYIVAVTVELNCWLGELQYQLLLAIEIIEISQLPSFERLNGKNELKTLLMSELRHEFIKKADVLFISQLRRHELVGLDLKSRVARQKYLLSLVEENKIHARTEMEIITKTYVNLRLFILNVSLPTPIISTIIMGAYFLNFGSVIIALLMSRSTKDFTTEQAVVIAFSWMVSNLYVFICANFHAKSKRLHSMIWQLVARISAARGTHIEHLATLWERQVSQLDMDRGLCLKASEFRITYLNMFQMMISTATLLVMATN